ncbi:hypothetical protein ACP70R_034991 [Stipagrostis hirtigluma subsp. patula]
MARRHWLTDKQYLAILLNPVLYQPDLFQEGMAGTIGGINAILEGVGENLFLCNIGEDGQIEGATLTETEAVRIDGRPYMELRRTYNLEFERREYFSRGYSELKLVHYMALDDGALRDKFLAKQLLDSMNLGIAEQNRKSGRKKRQILRRLRNESSGSDSSGDDGDGPGDDGAGGSGAAPGDDDD